ncbi:MAG: hypothetical protein LBT74_10510 [Acidobacteriota bacterium]|jgi:hypothetical protein|nr:hypothetical protein [Acidobacteriota bacterium]
MGRKTNGRKGSRGAEADAGELARIRKLEAQLELMSDGRALFWTAPGCPPEVRRAGLEDVLAFEDVGAGVPLFEGLRMQGLDLPNPDTLSEKQSADKAEEVLNALLDLQIILVGFEQMSGRQLYATLWRQTLWEGCYIKKRLPGSVTILDVSHSIPQTEMLQCLDDVMKLCSIH